MSEHVSTARIHEALDGELTAAEMAVMEGHLLECTPCRDEYARLSEVVDSIRSLPRGGNAPDVWGEIQARIGERVPGGGEDDVKVLALPGRGDRYSARRISFSVPQLAAAAIVVSVLSAGIALRVARGPEVSPQLAQGSTPTLVGAAARAVSSEGSRYGEVVLQLEQILEEGRAVLSPETLTTIEASLTTVNAAITDVEQALADDPGSDLLLRMLANYQRTKLGVLQRAAAAVHAQT